MEESWQRCTHRWDQSPTTKETLCGGNDDDGPFESCESLRENGLEDDDAGHDGWSMQAAGRELDSSI